MRIFVRICALLPAFPLVLFCQARLTLAEAISQALARNPEVAVAAAQIGIAEGLRQQAGLSPNPRVIFQLENTRFWGAPAFSYPQDTATYSYVTQTLETAGKRARRVDLASENLRNSDLQLQLERRQVVSRVSTAYWAAAGAARVRDLLQADVVNFDRVVELNRNRVREGATPEVDLLRVEVERDRLSGLSTDAAREADRTRVAMFREMGVTEFRTVEYLDSLEQEPLITSLTPNEALDRRIEMKMAREGILQAQDNLRLQRANAKPDPDVQLGYERIGGFDTLYFGAVIPLPIRNRNQGQIEAAAAGIRSAESSVAATEAAIRSEIEIATQDFTSRQRLLNETLRPMHERAEQVYRIMDAAYRETGSDILRLLDAERSKIETESTYVRALSEFQRSAVALETAQGNLP